MGDHQHQTHLVDGVVLVECPEGHDVARVDYTANKDNSVLEDILDLISERGCTKCGADLSHLQYEEPIETLK